MQRGRLLRPRLPSVIFTARRLRSDFEPVDLPAIDKIWREKWKAEGYSKGLKALQKDGCGHGTKMYNLAMFAYPSGDLHLGHLRVYTISDVLSRFRRMQGYDVLHPAGWDAFGLPAENAAIERGIDPATWTKQNIEKMKSQFEAMNGHWDWDKEFATCDPSFYKHTQALFIRLYEDGLVYQANSLVNYDPVDKTVLANEQVDSQGNSWRSGAKVEKKMLKQWFFKITAYRQELLDGLKALGNNEAWPKKVLTMQKNWIGKSTGARIKFPVTHSQESHPDIEVFTTRPDTIFGVQYIALASSHPIVRNLVKKDAKLQAFVDTIPGLPLDSKAGYLLPDIHAHNPLASEESTPDATKAPLPIYVAPYVLADYGDGAVMGVPGHDTRDSAFWKHNQNDHPSRLVVSESLNGSMNPLTDKIFVGDGYLTSHSGQYAGMTTGKAAKEIVSLLESRGSGVASETWRLRDWLISRQRYWGTPIPIIHCESCGPVSVPSDQLPVELPPVEEHWTSKKVGNPLAEAHEWINTSCPKCSSPAKRDTDTMDTFVDSSWYFMRFPDAHNQESPFDPDVANANLPVDLYIGGNEHAILHLLYARFISKYVASTPLWPKGPKFNGEPFKQVLTQGMVHGKTYSDPTTGRFLKPHEVELQNTPKPVVRATGEDAIVSFEKMSKSKYNGVDPTACIAKYGADATRAHMLFQAPVTEVLNWDEVKISGVTNWLGRIHRFVEEKQADVFSKYGHESFDANRHFSMCERILKQFKQSPDVHIKQLQEEAGNSISTDGYEDLKAQTKLHIQADMDLWRSVQRTVTIVTESYSKTYSLNTVVSDLMSLTNETIEHSNICSPIRGKYGAAVVNARITHEATLALLKMMAPITPAFAEEQYSKFSNGISDSIFYQNFPIPDGTFDLLAPTTQLCAIQVNGKKLIVVRIPNPPKGMGGTDLEEWLTGEIVETIEWGKFRANQEQRKKNVVDIRKARKVHVARGGKTVNYIV